MPSESSRREMVSWEELDKLIDHLVPQFTREFTAMVIITRGGIIPGGMLADAMDITHILTAAVDFPAQMESQKTSAFMAWPEFIQFPAEDKLRGRPTLIVDDVWGSGRTITAVKNRVSAAGGFLCDLWAALARNHSGSGTRKSGRSRGARGSSLPCRPETWVELTPRRD